jgi:DNA (cytosine-5)-methyltransferase 1
MPRKYSEIRKKLNIENAKQLNDGLASITHYFQNSGSPAELFFSKHANEYYSTGDKLILAEDPLVNGFLPIKWDIPFPPAQKPKFTFIDLFAGIGGIRLAYQNLGGKCVFTSEWNYPAKRTYEANFGEVPFGDITQFSENDIPDHDVLLAGFPCQPFSIAGVSKKNALGRAHGFLDETQGTLFFDIARIINKKRPKAFMLENVKNLVSHDKKKTFQVISKTLEELNYSIHYKVLDSKHFVPQHRERIIIVGFNKDIYHGNERFEFPLLPPADKKFHDLMESNPDSKYTLTDNLWIYLQKYAKGHKEKGNGFGFGMVDLNGITRTISARYYKDGSEVLIPQHGLNPRRLTPRECARLQGYPDQFIIPVSDTQAYKQFGNSVTVPLIQSVGKQVLKVLLNYDNISESEENIR